jgi:hypothetical protein
MPVPMLDGQILTHRVWMEWQSNLRSCGGSLGGHPTAAVRRGGGLATNVALVADRFRKRPASGRGPPCWLAFRAMLATT